MNILEKMAHRHPHSSTLLRRLGAISFLLCMLAARLSAQAVRLSVRDLPDAPMLQAAAADSADPTADSADLAAAVTASIRGSVADVSGAVIAGATVTLENITSHHKKTASTSPQGDLVFTDVKAGTYVLTIQAAGFAPLTTAAIALRAGENTPLPLITLTVATVGATVHVTPQTQMELAQAQVKEEEKQRLLYVIPNFYVVYNCDPAPLTPKLKFALASRVLIDPYVFAVTGFVAGIYQATDTWNGYGQGAAGYGRRYGAQYGNIVISTFLGGGILPVLLHQDPRYFYKGTGSVRSRVGYALLAAVRTKGDNGRWQPDYSGFLGLLGGAAITNTYLEPRDRVGIGGMAISASTGLGITALGALAQEFLFLRFTTHHPRGEKCE